MFLFLLFIVVYIICTISLREGKDRLMPYESIPKLMQKLTLKGGAYFIIPQIMSDLILFIPTESTMHLQNYSTFSSYCFILKLLYCNSTNE